MAWIQQFGKEHAGSVVGLPRITKDRVYCRSIMHSGEKLEEQIKMGKMNLRKNLKIAKIGAWNVRGLKQIEKLQLMGKELERIAEDIYYVESRKQKVLPLENSIQWTIIWWLMILSGKERNPHHGVGMWNHKKNWKALIDFEPVNEPIFVVRLCSKPVDLMIIGLQCYAPTSIENCEFNKIGVLEIILLA